MLELVDDKSTSFFSLLFRANKIGFLVEQTQTRNSNLVGSKMTARFPMPRASEISIIKTRIKGGENSLKTFVCLFVWLLLLLQLLQLLLLLLLALIFLIFLDGDLQDSRVTSFDKTEPQIDAIEMGLQQEQAELTEWKLNTTSRQFARFSLLIKLVLLLACWFSLILTIGKSHKIKNEKERPLNRFLCKQLIGELGNRSAKL